MIIGNLVASIGGWQMSFNNVHPFNASTFWSDTKLVIPLALIGPTTAEAARARAGTGQSRISRIKLLKLCQSHQEWTIKSGRCLLFYIFTCSYMNTIVNKILVLIYRKLLIVFASYWKGVSNDYGKRALPNMHKPTTNKISLHKVYFVAKCTESKMKINII